MQRVSGQPEHAVEALLAVLEPPLRPVEGRALGVCIEQRHAASRHGQLASQVRGERGLARAAFLVEQRDHLAGKVFSFWQAVFGCSDCLSRRHAQFLSSRGSRALDYHLCFPLAV